MNAPFVSPIGKRRPLKKRPASNYTAQPPVFTGRTGTTVFCDYSARAVRRGTGGDTSARGAPDGQFQC